MQRALGLEHTKGAGLLRSRCQGNVARTTAAASPRLLCWKGTAMWTVCLRTSFPSWNFLSKATASFFPTLRTAHSQHVKRGGKKGGREFQGAKHGKYKQGPNPEASGAEGAGGGGRCACESEALTPLLPEKHPVPPPHCPAELQAGPLRPEPRGPTRSRGGRSEAQKVSKCLTSPRTNTLKILQAPNGNSMPTVC